MKFKLGVAAGFAAGYWYASLSEEERRQKFEATVDKVRTNPRVQQVTDSVSRNATKVTDAVTTRVTETANKAGDAVASTAAPGDTSSSAGTTGTTRATSSSPSS
jgi:hypothetical protein